MLPNSPDLVILFTRYPQPGQCKTRLIPALGPDGAAALHREMTGRIVTELAALAVLHPHRLEIHYDGGSPAEMAAWLGKSHQYRRQGKGDIGCRMRAAIGGHQGRMQRLLLVGSDCPDLSAELLRDAFVALRTHDLVLGPAFDGGYYLIGVHNQSASLVCQTLFQGIPWSTDRVYAITQERAEQLRLRCHTLTRLHDIDTPEDLGYFHYHPHPE
jgi:rSAM/selenodomain-associated transferase 1